MRSLLVFFAVVALAVVGLLSAAGVVGGETQTAAACHVANPNANPARGIPPFNPHECNAQGRNDVEQAAIAANPRGGDICDSYDTGRACADGEIVDLPNESGICGPSYDYTIPIVRDTSECSTDNPRAINAAYFQRKRAECQARTDLNRTLNPNGNPRLDANGIRHCAGQTVQPPQTPGAGIFSILGDAANDIFGSLLGAVGGRGNVKPSPLNTGRDTDGDGTPDRDDNDKDGDGTPNNSDSTPCGSRGAFENASGVCVSCAFGYQRSGNSCELRGVGDDDDGTETPPDDPGVRATTTAPPVSVNLTLGADPFEPFELPTLVNSLSLSVGANFDGARTVTLLGDAQRTQLEEAYFRQWRGVFSLTTAPVVYPQTITVSGVVRTLTAAPPPAAVGAFSVSLTAGFATLTTQLRGITLTNATLGLGKAIDAVEAFGGWLENRLSLSAALSALEATLTLAAGTQTGGGVGAWPEGAVNQWGDRWLIVNNGWVFWRSGSGRQNVIATERALTIADCGALNSRELGVCRLANPPGSARMAACISACFSYFTTPATTSALGSVVVSVIEGSTLSLVSRYALSLATLAARGGEISGVSDSVEQLITLAGAGGDHNFNIALVGNFAPGGFGETAGGLFGSFAARAEDCPNYSVLCFVKSASVANVQLYIRPWNFLGFRDGLIPGFIRAISVLLALVAAARVIALGN